MRQPLMLKDLLLKNITNQKKNGQEVIWTTI